MNHPKVENAPGLVFRARKVGFVGFWQARSDLVKRGYHPQTVPLWRGLEPSLEDTIMMQNACQDMQAEMLAWARGGVPEFTTFDGTVRSLIDCYRRDADSPFRKLRYGSRKNYDKFLHRIETDHGDVRLSELKAREMKRWHEEWTPRGVAMAHSLMKIFRAVLTFGATILDSEDCQRVKGLLTGMRFKMAQPRTSFLTYEMAQAIIALAHEKGWHSVALAQAVQFDAMLRQKDVIGEWVPISEPGLSDVQQGNDKWLRGITWNEIDRNLVLRHVTSKRQKEIELDLRMAPLVMAEFERIGFDKLPEKGPLIVREDLGKPYRANDFRYRWRVLANELGIPKNVRNQDSRAGAITEATEAGADLESIKHAATHSDISMTQRYARNSTDKAAKVLQMRVRHREGK